MGYYGGGVVKRENRQVEFLPDLRLVEMLNAAALACGMTASRFVAVSIENTVALLLGPRLLGDWFLPKRRLDALWSHPEWVTNVTLNVRDRTASLRHSYGRPGERRSGVDRKIHHRLVVRLPDRIRKGLATAAGMHNTSQTVILEAALALWCGVILVKHGGLPTTAEGAREV